MSSDFSRVIQGCMNWGKWGNSLSTSEMEKLIHFNLESGISSFDHADIYGDYTTESDFGKAFKNSTVKREDIQLISKCGIQYVGKSRPNNTVKHYQYDSNYIIYSAEKSIKDLNAEYLDLFLLHRPSPLMHPDEIREGIEKLLNDGKIKSFGVSNFSNGQTDLISTCSKVSANQIQFSLSYNTPLFDSTLDYMMINNITPMSWSPLGSFFKNQNDNKKVHDLLSDLSKKYNASKDQLLLAWVLKHPSCIHPVIGTTKTERINAASTSTQIKLSKIDWFRMLETYLGHKLP
jgi:predicted oxidoreductase